MPSHTKKEQRKLKPIRPATKRKPVRRAPKKRR